MKKCIVLAENDNVATVLESVSSGEEVVLMDSTFATKGSIVAIEDIPYMHKICLRKMLESDCVIKFDACIGVSTMEIDVGQLVHIHNMISLVGTRK